jgi:Carboxypeptidase regulatory-like domain
MPEKVTVHGIVRDGSQKPIPMIRVVAVQDGREIERTYTSDDGRYSFEVPRGLTTLSFDAHGTLTNARDWHPSVVANLDTNVEEKYLRCDRVLLKGGTTASDEACVDALAGYMFSLMWTARRPDRAYAEAAEARLSSMKMPLPELDKFRGHLRELFAKRARAGLAPEQ